MAKKHLSEIQQDAANVNKHSERGSALTRKSIEKFGARLAGVVDRRGVIIDGNDRQIAYGELDLSEVEIVKANPTKPVYLQFDDLDLADPDNPARELQVALHRSAVESWTVDAEALMAHMQSGVAVDDWFRQDELDALMAELMPPATTGDTEPQIDKAAELQAKWQTSLGQLWALGEHRLIVGDCTDRATVERVLGGEKARYGIQDPPYGISVVGGSKAFGSVGGSNIVQANRYAPIVDDDKPYDPTYILSVCHDSVLWGANYYADKLPPKKGWIVWDKKGKDWDDNFSDCELAWTPFDVVTKIYRHVWMGIIQEGKRETRQHPTQKPSGLYEKIISDLFVDDGVIVDFYLGSGTTLIACENLSRRCRAVEISPAYCAVAIERWAQHTGQTPRLVT